jgi:hypothetical protein
MSSRMLARRALAAAAIPLLAVSGLSQTFGPDFVNDYTLVDLGGPPGVPAPLGGLTFKAGDNNKLLIGGAANSGLGAVHEITVTRDPQGHVNGFSGSATQLATAPNIDGGLTYGPGGVLFFVTYNDNRMGQLKPGSTAPDKFIDLTPLGVCSSTGALYFVPAGFPGAGAMKLASYNCGNWYEGTFAPDGSGTYNLSSVAPKALLTGGPEGMVYIDATNPGFSADSVLVSEYSSGRVSAYQVDASGDPLPATRRDFLLSLNGAEGAAIDPLTGDFLFSTFGGGDRVIVVQGFNAPTVYCSGKTHSAGCVPTIQFAGAPALTGPDTFSVSSQLEPNNVNGALVWGLAPASVPFAGGILCVQAPSLGSFGGQSSGGNPGIAIDCSGKLGFDVKQSFFTGHGLAAGTSVYMQFLARDPGSAPPNNVSLSDALTYVIQP